MHMERGFRLQQTFALIYLFPDREVMLFLLAADRYEAPVPEAPSPTFTGDAVSALSEARRRVSFHKRRVPGMSP